MTTSHASRLALVLAAALALVACGEDPETPPPPPGREEQAAESPDEASPPVGGDEEGVEVPTTGGACVEGWREPETPEERELPFHVIRRTMQVDGDFQVEDLRYFEGPESPPSDKGYLLRVDRWYVKGWLKTDPSFRARWLIEERTFGSGVAAVAPFDSTGYESPDWVGFQYEQGDTDRRTYPGLPGEWAGRPYDYITGEDLETGERVFRFPGLPREVAGCLQDT